MSGKVHLVRHAEGVHNLYNDTSIPDAPLTQRGFDFADELGKRFVKEHTNSIGSVIASPLRRAIQTSLTAFPRLLSSDLYPPGSGKGVRNGVSLELYTNLQELDDVPANTGSDSADLLSQFPELATQIQNLPNGWNDKSTLPTGSRRKSQILERIERALTGLNGLKEIDVVVVTHSGIIQLLAQGVDIGVAQWKTFSLIRGSNGQLSLHEET